MTRNTKLILIGIVFLLLGIYLFLFGFPLRVTEGQSTGIITSTKTIGVIFKTHRAYFKTDEESSQEKKFCVISDRVFKELKEAEVTRQKVTISHHADLFFGWVECFQEGEAIHEVKM